MIWTYVVLGVIDLVQTLYGLSNGLIEANPIMANVEHNLIVLTIIKVVGTVLVALLAKHLYKKFPKKWMDWVMCVVIGIQGLAVLANFVVLYVELWR